MENTKKINYYPCQTCYLRFNKQYSSECDDNCDYAKAIKLLKQVLIKTDKCFYCKNYDGCINQEKCENYNLFELDYEKIEKNHN